MSVLIETSAGELVVDLYVDDCPKACENFLKLCQIKYYNNCLIFQVQRNHLIQAGDPTATGKSGSSIWGLLKAAESGRGFFPDEIVPNLRFNKPGLLCMANQGPNTNTSQFFITLRDTDLEYLEEKHTIFGCVAEGLDTTLKAINETELDLQGRPLFDIRLLHTHILDDPFPEPDGISNLVRDSTSHKPDEEQVEERIPYGTDLNDNGGKTEEQLEAERKEKETKARAQVLTILGDLPDADVKPPENVLFVCKLNPVTEDEDLELIFSRFGEIKSCEVIRDPKTGDSLQYAFIEFANEAQCQEAYLKMNNVLIDERRIKVDFSQSVSKLWNKWAIGSRQPQTNSGSGMSQRSKLGITKSHNSIPLRDEPNNSSRRKDYGHHRSRHRSGRSKSRDARSKRPYGSETKYRYQSSDRRVSSRSSNRSNTATGNKHSRRSSRERSTGRSRRRRSKSYKSSRKRTRSRSKMRRSK